MTIEELIDFYQKLTPESIARFPDFYSTDAYFKDPFNEVQGVVAIQHIFSHMFRQVGDPRFIVSESIVDADGAMLVWTFSFQMGRRKATTHIRGVSHLKFDAKGKVNYHRDYWDAAEELYLKIPVLGILMRRLRRALAA